MREPIPIVRQAEEDAVAILARIEAREKAAVQFTQEHILAQGEDLAKLKKQQGYGNWTRWAAKHLTGFGLRQAQNYIRVWERSKNEVDFVFETLEEALRIISEEVDEATQSSDPPPRPSKNGAVDPEHDGSECDGPTPPDDPDPDDDDKGDAWEPPSPTTEPATTSPDDAGTISRIEAAQKGLKGLGQMVRSLESLKLLAKFRDPVQQIKDTLDRYARGKK